MSAKDPKLQAIFAHLDDRDEWLRARAAGLERPLLLNLLRAIDVAGYVRAHDPGRVVPGMPGYLDVGWMGAAHAIQLLAPAGMQGPGNVWHLPQPEQLAWATSFLYRAGLVVHLRRLAELVRYGLADAEVIGDHSVRFLIRARDREAIDREAIDWYAGHVGALDAPVLKGFRDRYDAPVRAELAARVSADPMFGIRYSSSRELEECFEFEAELRARTLPGHDALPFDAKLGPLTFGEYRTAVVTGMARSLKHVAFVEALLARDPSTPRAVLTIHSHERKLKDEWGGLLGLDDAHSGVLLDVMGMTPKDIPELRKAWDCPQALIVRAGDVFWQQPVFGGLNNPFTWVTRKLRRTFRSDWDRAVNGREATFREDLRIVFYEPLFWFAPTTLKLRGSGGVKTDIDAIVIDRVSGTMAVFQLKWQDAFENSLTERESRRRNLAAEGNAWIETVLSHCHGCSPGEAARRIGVPVAEAASVKTMRLFILTRNAAQFSGPADQDRRAAWLSWYDMLRRCNRARREPDPLSTAWRSGRRRGAEKPDRSAQVFEVDGIRVESIEAT
ncbi:hypothetical protein [Phenylobacterium sp.]|uniref:hypothetical protein n=1 Tax=Phenylobacterium sp. TaxID=1871053 RepID=UPI002FC6B6B1